MMMWCKGYFLFSSPFFAWLLFMSCGPSFYPCPWPVSHVRTHSNFRSRPLNLSHNAAFSGLLKNFSRRPSYLR